MAHVGAVPHPRGLSIGLPGLTVPKAAHPHHEEIDMDVQSRIEILEAALAEYVARYGFTEKARAAMIRGGSSPTNLDAESGERGTGDEAHSPTDRLPQG